MFHLSNHIYLRICIQYLFFLDIKMVLLPPPTKKQVRNFSVHEIPPIYSILIYEGLKKKTFKFCFNKRFIS